MRIKSLRNVTRFSLLTKVPKTIKPPQQNKSWFSKLFTSNQNSATYILLQQLFQYLKHNDVLQRQFPYLKNTQRIEQNSMLLHVHLLRDRIKQETNLPRSELQKYTYNLQAHFFPDYASYVNTAIPTQNFREHFAQAYQNKLQIYSQLVQQHEWRTNPNKQLLSFEQYAPILRKVIYENRVGVDHIELLKFCKYYVAHKKYLNMLDWDDMIHYKVKWGLESLKYIGELQSTKKS